MDLFKEILRTVLITEDTDINDVENAIDNRKVIKMTYSSKNSPHKVGERTICPVAYGLSTAGNPVVRAFETDEMSRGWRFFVVDRIKSWQETGENFNPDELKGVNKSGDLRMSVVYKVLGLNNNNGQNKEIGSGAATVGDANAGGQKKTGLVKGQEYTAKQVIDDVLGGVTSTWDKNLDRDAVNISQEKLNSLEADNAKKQLANAQNNGETLDNERELTHIANGKIANRMLPPKTEPVMANKIIGQQGQEQQTANQVPSNSPVSKEDLEDENNTEKQL